MPGLFVAKDGHGPLLAFELILSDCLPNTNISTMKGLWLLPETASAMLYAVTRKMLIQIIMGLRGPANMSRV